MKNTMPVSGRSGGLPWLVVVTMLVVVFQGLIGPAHATTSTSDGKTAYLQAANGFRALMTKLSGDGKMPRLEEPDAAELINRLSDQSTFLESPRFDDKNLGDLMEICSAANQVVMSYVLFDVQSNLSHEDTGASPDEKNRQVRDVIRNNVLSFHPELTLLQPFLLRCAALQIPIMNQYVSSQSAEQLTNMRRAGFSRTRSQLYTTYYGFLQMAQHEKAGAVYRKALLDALASTAEAFASAIRPLDRRLIGVELDLLEQSLKALLADNLKAIRVAMTRPTCVGLCQY